jgi:uncharacterized protein YjbJ (UPF0337 family)
LKQINQFSGGIMNKDQVAGKLKDVAGRVERQTGEWTGDTEKQAHGAMKQAEGKVQNAWGNVKDASEKAVNKNATREKDPVVVDDDVEKENEDMASRRKAS